VAEIRVKAGRRAPRARNSFSAGFNILKNTVAIHEEYPFEARFYDLSP
jgi:hypothetical protein